jgi:type IV pilus assembly protein PilX
MNSVTAFLHCRRQRRKRGFILISSLLMLLMLSILTISMSKSFGLQELIAGNQREKIRALESANSALNYAEWWLNQGNATTGAGNTCNSITTTPIVCPTSLANTTTLPWTAGVSYTPPNMSISTSGGVGSYYAIPMFYIQYLGNSPNTGKYMYQITARGYGGDSGSVAVIQSIFEFQ